ncbi:protein kinase superfamily protein isoform X2 [Wolffia australiana]
MATDLDQIFKSTASEAEIDAAWYVLTVLMRLGRRARIDDLVPRCKLFSATREFLVFLCRMPNSPLSIADDEFVSVSSRVEVTFREFVVGGDNLFVPRVGVRSERPCGGVLVPFSCRKRKILLDLPDPKRRSPLRLTNGGRFAIASSSFESTVKGIDRYLHPVRNLFESTFPPKVNRAVQSMMRYCNFPPRMIIADHASEAIKEAIRWIPQICCSDESDVDLRLPAPDLDSETTSTSVPWNHRKQNEEKIYIFDDNVAELVVDDSEDKIDQPQESLADKSLNHQIDVRLSPEEAGHSLQPSSQQPKENAFCDQLDAKQAVSELLKEPAMENNKSIKSKLKETLDSKMVLKKLKKPQINKLSRKGNKEETFAVSKEEPSKKLPQFESFIVEEEEGSGGYGTVYRARRKTDGKTFAIKCPHPKAHAHHIHNELKMLQRFGGKCFIIKYEGFFKSGGSECFVLEHVEHDRPEALKKEISISELQWYGFCMFRALASLHKQGVVHRDVKPGNFLFSRKLNKGYLIDFNLAQDLNQKLQANSKQAKTMSLSSSFSHQMFRPKAKKPAVAKSDDYRNKQGCGHAGEGSGVTSAREATSTRTPSGDRMREPVPCRGRKELISLAQQAMQSPGKVLAVATVAVPVQRKRVAAPLGKEERHLAFLSPMPLLCNGIPLSPATRCSSPGREKRQKTEGPCVGTKGFRAPEVLLKSIHQSCKIDIWSAGVTLLYLIIGRSPFAGDPEQNIKEIARLRGSEELWEVAKLHNRESSFPPELLEVEWLRRTRVEEWCRRNGKRGVGLVEAAPDEMWDLVDRCLSVNPRLRISAEEALAHDFFAPCRDSLRRQRALRHNAAPTPPSL